MSLPDYTHSVYELHIDCVIESEQRVEGAEVVPEQRIDDPQKNWKISEADVKERTYWDDYMGAYEDALTECSTERAPWYVIPANKKSFRNLAVSQILVDAMASWRMRYPQPPSDLAKLGAALRKER